MWKFKRDIYRTEYLNLVYRNFLITEEDGQLVPFTPLIFNSGVTYVNRITSVQNDNYILNGEFSTVNDGMNTTPGIAIMENTTYKPNLLPITTTIVDYVNATVEDNDFYYIAGEITSLGSTTGINNIFKIAKTGSTDIIDSTFNTNVGTGPNGSINSMIMFQSIYGPRLVVGGNFTHWNGLHCGAMVILELDGTIYSGFGTNMFLVGYVNNFKVYNNHIIVYGSLTSNNLYVPNPINNFIQMDDEFNVIASNPAVAYGEIADVSFLIDSSTLETALVFATPTGLWVEGLNGGSTFGNLTPGLACNSAAAIQVDSTYSLVGGFGSDVKKFNLTSTYVATEDTSFKLKSVDGTIFTIDYDDINQHFLYGGSFTLI